MPRLELHSYVFANYFLYLFNCFWHYIYRTHYVNSLEICHRLWKVSFGSELFIVSCERSLSLSFSLTTELSVSLQLSPKLSASALTSLRHLRDNVFLRFSHYMLNPFAFFFSGPIRVKKSREVFLQ